MGLHYSYKPCMQNKTVKKKVQRKRTETTYCANLRDAMRNNLPLRANRRGVIFNSNGERPSFAIDELYRNRRMGLSYKQIGKKLGIDPDRENVIHVYKALCEEAEEELHVPPIEDRCSIQGNSTHSSLVFVRFRVGSHCTDRTAKSY